MIPTLLVAGLAAGAIARLKVLILVGVASAAAWGIIVGVVDGSVSTLFAGAGLGAANFVVGAAVGHGAGRISSRAQFVSK